MYKKLLSLCVALLIGSTAMKAQQWNGYFLVAPQNQASVTLYDTSWTAYKTWTGLAGSTGYSAYVMPGGYLWRAAKATSPSFTGGPICGRVTKHDYSGMLLWDYTYSTTAYCTHHDIQPLPNGNVLLISYERKTATEVAAAGCTSFSSEMWPDKIVEVQPTGATTGNVVWEWHTWDHLMQNVDATKANYVTSLVNNPQLININYKATKDWQHMNGVDYNPILDQIAFSSHNHNEWFIIDHSTTTAEAASHTGGNAGKGGDILYRWGNPAAYGATGTAILNVTHDAHWADEFSTVPGRLCGYNNGGGGTQQSAADQVITPISGYNYSITAGSAFLPTTYDHRSTVSGMYSSNMGSTQQLPNGNELVQAPTSNMVREFNSAGAVIFSHSASSAQVKKYSACYITNEPPAIPTITANGNVLSSSTATSYQWYMNGQKISGATSQTYTATQAGKYVVRITDANGCVYQYSSTFVKFPLGIVDVNFNDKLTIYPNPTTGIVNIKSASQFGKQYSIQVVSSLGNVVKTFYNAETIDISSLANGNYFIKLTSDEGTATKQISLTK